MCSLWGLTSEGPLDEEQPALQLCEALVKMECSVLPGGVFLKGFVKGRRV